MKYNRLGATDMQVSELSFGGSTLGNCYGDVDFDSKKNALIKAIKEANVNYIDTAPWYGNLKSERVIGEILQEVPREAYFIGTKVGRYEPEPSRMFDWSYGKTIASVKNSLELLKIECIDLIQVHDPEFCSDYFNQIIEETLPALDELRRQGKVRYIGINGYPMYIYEELLRRSSVKIDTLLTYARLTPINNDFLEELERLKEKKLVQNVGVINAAATGMGLLTPGSKVMCDWHPGRKETKQAVFDALGQVESLFPGVNIVRICVRYPIERLNKEICQTTLVGIRSVEEVEWNFMNLEPLSDVENSALDFLINKFNDLDTSWEGVEFAAFHKNFT